MAIQISPDLIEYCRNEMRSDRIRVIDGEPAITVTIRPDKVIGPREAPWLIVDAKYKKSLRENSGGRYFHNDDLYQAFSYANALDAPTVLVYPNVDQDIEVALKVEEEEVRIVSIDLGKLPLGSSMTFCSLGEAIDAIL